MTLTRKLSGAAAALLLTTSLGQASTLTFFESEANFRNAIAFSVMQDFEGIVPDGSFGTVDEDGNFQRNIVPSFTIDGVEYRSTSDDAIIVSPTLSTLAGGPVDSALLVTNTGGALSVDLTGAGEGFTAFGARFGGLNGAGEGNLLLVGEMDQILDSFFFGFEDFSLDSLGTFIGFTSDVAITRVLFSSFGPFEAIDDVIYGRVEADGGVPAPVPLPAGLPLMLGALGSFALLRRRRGA